MGEGASQEAAVVKNLPASAGDIRDVGSIPGLARSPAGGHDNPLYCTCLENPMDRGAWWAAVHRVTESQTRLKRLSTHTQWEKMTQERLLPQPHCFCIWLSAGIVSCFNVSTGGMVLSKHLGIIGY